ncbi:2-dehydropantoate 2-reductase [Asticcacaulis solisilvae]|uniref:2-dehydropantoate 2-reductase n=1 Tax=Asticcacaulis solisilvae TaxID=1217274 RepID=UPI003FD7F804
MSTITLIGPGAIGLSVASGLMDAGHDVTFVARQPFETLDVTRPGGEVRSHAARVVEAANAPKSDWVFLCVKTYQVASAAEALKAAVGPDTRVAVIQNGVEHRENVAPFIHAETPVVPVVIDLPASRSAPGKASFRNPSLAYVEDTDAGRAFQTLFAGTFLEVTATPDLVTRMWRKLCINAPGAVLCLTGKPMGVFHEPGIADIARAILSECVAVGRAAGAEFDGSVIEDQMAAFMNARPDDGNSMFDDFRAGRPMEWDARNGVVARTGRLYGIPTPVSDLVVPILRAQSSPR